MVVENRIIEKCLFIIFFNIENCNINTYFKFFAPYLQAGEKKATSSPYLYFSSEFKDRSLIHQIRNNTPSVGFMQIYFIRIAN